MCVSQPYLNFTDVQVCICNPSRALSVTLGMCSSGVSAGWQGSGPGWQDVGAPAALCPGCLPSRLTVRTFGVALHALQPACALSTFSRLFFLLHTSSPFSLISVVWKHSCLFLVVLPYTSLTSIFFRESATRREVYVHHQNVGSLSVLCARQPC